MKLFTHRAASAVVLVLALALACGCGGQGSQDTQDTEPAGSGGGGSEGAEPEPTPTTSVTPTPPAMGGALIKTSMYAWLPGSGAGSGDVQTEDGEAYLVFERQDGPPMIYTVHGAGSATWTEEADFDVCSWSAKADIQLKVEGVLDPAACEVKLVITEIFDDPVMTSQSGACGEVEFTVETWTYRVDLPLVNGEARPAGTSIYDPTVTISDIVLHESIPCIVP